MYAAGDQILMVASDRISTYDVVHPTPIPDKGKVLTGLSVFWFGRTLQIVPNHHLSATEGVPEVDREPVSHKLEPLHQDQDPLGISEYSARSAGGKLEPGEDDIEATRT